MQFGKIHLPDEHMYHIYITLYSMFVNQTTVTYVWLFYTQTKTVGHFYSFMIPVRYMYGSSAFYVLTFTTHGRGTTYVIMVPVLSLKRFHMIYGIEVQKLKNVTNNRKNHNSSFTFIRTFYFTQNYF